MRPPPSDATRPLERDAAAFDVLRPRARRATPRVTRGGIRIASLTSSHTHESVSDRRRRRRDIDHTATALARCHLFEARARHSGDVFRGLFGGYSAYEHFVCNRLLPPRRAARHTLRLLNDDDPLVRASDAVGGAALVALSASYNLNKCFFLRPADGAVLVESCVTRARRRVPRPPSASV